MKRYIKAKTISLLEEDSDTLKYFAKDPNTDPEVLAEISNCNNADILCYLAKNPSTPHNILRKLFAEHTDLNLYLAENTNLPADLCEELASPASHIVVRTELADNPCLPVSIMERFSDDKDTDIRQVLTFNLNLPKYLIEKLANDKDPQVRKRIALHPNISMKLLRKLSKDDKWFVREIANDTIFERGGTVR